MMPSWFRQVNWGNCGIPWVNCTVMCVKFEWKGQFWGLRYCLCSLLSFSVRYDVTSKIAQFNWECTGHLKQFSPTSRRNTDFHFFLAPFVTLISSCCDLRLYVIFLRRRTNSESRLTAAFVSYCYLANKFIFFVQHNKADVLPDFLLQTYKKGEMILLQARCGPEGA